MRCIKTAVMAAAIVGLSAFASSASAQVRIQVDFNPTGPTAFSPLATVFHDGSFNSFNSGDNLSGTALEILAETGDLNPFLGTAPASANTGTNGGGTGPGVASSFQVDVDSSNTNFSFASMVLFSSDWFIGNSDSNFVDISSLLNGNVGDSLSIDLNTVYDAGTETEDYTGVGGSAFFPFVTSGALGVDVTNSSVSVLDRSTNPFLNFTNNDNLDLAGFDPASLDGFTATSLGNITLSVVAIPEPSSAIVGIFGGVALMLRRRKR